MLIKYRKGRQTACYIREDLITVSRESEPPLSGPFPTCEGCPYPGTGFLCYTNEGNCMRTMVQKIMERRKLVSV